MNVQPTMSAPTRPMLWALPDGPKPSSGPKPGGPKPASGSEAGWPEALTGSQAECWRGWSEIPVWPEAAPKK